VVIEGFPKEITGNDGPYRSKERRYRSRDLPKVNSGLTPYEKAGLSEKQVAGHICPVTQAPFANNDLEQSHTAIQRYVC